MYLIYFSVSKSFILKNEVEICSATFESNLYVLRLLASKMLLNTYLFKTPMTKNEKQSIPKKMPIFCP